MYSLADAQAETQHSLLSKNSAKLFPTVSRHGAKIYSPKRENPEPCLLPFVEQNPPTL